MNEVGVILFLGIIFGIVMMLAISINIFMIENKTIMELQNEINELKEGNNNYVSEDNKNN